MKRIDFQKIKLQNFLSIGNTPVEIDFKKGLSVITGINRDEDDIKNGAGKCLRENTEVDLVIANPEALGAFLDIIGDRQDLGPYKIKDLYTFFKRHPWYADKVYVRTRFGHKRVINCAITAYHSEVWRVDTRHRHVEASPNHLLYVKESENKFIWKAVHLLNVGDVLLTQDDEEVITNIEKLPFKDDLYDLEVEDVHEFYANGFVSHNSAISDGIFFAIFGTTIRDLAVKKFIVNRQTKKNCKVSLFFDITENGETTSYQIDRNIAPASLKIWKGDEEITLSTVPENNKFIKDLLSLNEDIVQNCLIMRANNTVPFMAKKKLERKNFIESIFNLSIFSEMLSHVRKDTNETKRKFDRENTAYSIIKNNCSTYQLQIDNLTQEAERKEREVGELRINLLSRINEETNKLKELSSKLIDVTDAEEKIAKITEQSKLLESKIRELQSLQTSISNQRYAANHDLQKLQNHGIICPTCKRQYDDDVLAKVSSDKEELMQKITQYDNQMKTLATTKNDLDTKHKTALELESKIKTLIINNNSTKDAISWTEKLIKSLQDQLDGLSISRDTNSISSFRKLLQEAQDELKIKKESIDTINKELSKLTVCEHILGENGVKSYIINKLLELLNNQIKFYLVSFKSMFDFTFNEVFEEEIKDSKGQLCSYGNCSGAEMKKIDMAISFAFMDILKVYDQIDFNLSFYDEILDSSIDNKTLEIIVDFIRKHALENNKSVYVVTHKNDIVLPELTETIVLEKKNGYTTILNNL